MSDMEDEMDLDGTSNTAILFGTNNLNVKGKRTAADLPVEAEDNLPWYASSYVSPTTYSLTTYYW